MQRRNRKQYRLFRNIASLFWPSNLTLPPLSDPLLQWRSLCLVNILKSCLIPRAVAAVLNSKTEPCLGIKLLNNSKKKSKTGLLTWPLNFEFFCVVVGISTLPVSAAFFHWSVESLDFRLNLLVLIGHPPLTSTMKMRLTRKYLVEPLTSVTTCWKKKYNVRSGRMTLRWNIKLLLTMFGRVPCR